MIRRRIRYRRSNPAVLWPEHRMSVWENNYVVEFDIWTFVSQAHTPEEEEEDEEA
jgi:hypothetical protein